jgi:hypothetical protein
MAEQLYALERLYEDQEPDLVTDTIPAVLAWLGATGEGPALSFSVRIGAKPAKEETLRLGYNGRVLEGRCSGTLDRARRMRSRRTADREHVTELAAYGLALVGISVWMPGRRAITFREGLPPDILLDDTDALCEASRSPAGRAAGTVRSVSCSRGRRTSLEASERSSTNDPTSPRSTSRCGAPSRGSRSSYG